MKKKLLFLLLVFLVSCDNIPTSSIDSFSSNSTENNTSSNISSTISQDSSTSINSSITSSSSSTNNTSSSYSSNTTSSSSSNYSSSANSSSSSSNSTIGNETNLYNAKIANNMPDNYYESCRGLKGSALKEALHNIIKGHTSFKYSKTSPFYKDIDQDPYDSSKMYYIYTGVTTIPNNIEYNKEHVWAKSHGKFEDINPMYSDLHNLHPCNQSLNTARSNYDFDEGGKLLSQYAGNNKLVDNVSFEPSDFSKGDVARTIFYMAVRYEGDNGEMDLEVSSPSSSNYYDFSAGADGVHGSFDALYKWATSGQDPVDDYEVSRNNKIYSNYQHNRNPFIDHPEFIQMIYDKNYNGAGALLDNNPYEEETEESKIERFINLVNSINDITLDTINIIESAESIYQSLSLESKEYVNDYYQTLVVKKTEYNNYFYEYNINHVIQLINDIGEVTLSSKNKIEQAEKAYNALTNDQKERITNYNILLEARETYDLLAKENEQNAFIFDFKNCTGASGLYKSAIVTYNDKSIDFSYCYKDADSLRFGYNSSSTVNSKFSNAIKGISSHSSSMELLFDAYGSTISLTTNGTYKTVYNLYLLKSNDNGTTWSLSNTITKNDVDFSNYQTFTFSLDSSCTRYAFVIDGNTPRLSLTQLEIK